MESAHLPVFKQTLYSFLVSVNFDYCYKSFNLVDKEGPYCATNGEKYSSKYDLYRDACAKEEIIEIDENCVAYYQKMIEFHQNELEKWTELLTSVTPAEAQERFSVFRVILKTQIIWAR